MHSSSIKVITLACIRENKLLLVQKAGLDFWILPGGKPESGESTSQTLEREIQEELGCQVTDLQLIFSTKDKVAGNSSQTLELILYKGELPAEFSLNAELVNMCWWHSNFYSERKLAPSLENSIIPFLISSNLIV